jgi:hypothetical protein
MPAALDVDWEAVRVLALAVGVREAARRMGLEQSTVTMRSMREGWLRDLPRSSRLPPTVLQPVVAVVKSPAAALSDVLREDGAATRLGHSRFHRKISENLAKEDDPDKLYALASVALTNIKGAALTHGWMTGQAPVVTVNVGDMRSAGGVVLDLTEDAPGEEP